MTDKTSTEEESRIFTENIEILLGKQMLRIIELETALRSRDEEISELKNLNK